MCSKFFCYRGSTVNIYGGTICGNTAQYGGGGIEVENGIGKTAAGKPYGSYFHMYGGSIVNNTVTETQKDDKNRTVHKGGGVHFAGGEMIIQSMNNKSINISGNTVADTMDNVYLRNGCTIYVYAQNGMYRKVKVTVK